MALKKKRFFTIGLAVLACSMTMVGLSACGKSDERSTYAQEFYAMSAISSINYWQNDAAQGQTAQTLADEQLQRPDTIQKTDVDNIANYMGMFEDMLASDTDKYYSHSAVSQDDTYASEYKLKMTLSVPKLGGGTEDFVMYYNEINTKTKEELDDNEIELEINTSLEGIIISGGATYNVVGEREYEKEGRETEISIKFTTYSSTNPLDFIVIENEMEGSEVEYEYSIYKNGMLASQTEVEFENERNEKSLELEFLNATPGSQNKVKYEITQSRTNPNQFEVFMKNASNESVVIERFTVTKTDSGYQFTYSNNYTEVI